MSDLKLDQAGLHDFLRREFPQVAESITVTRVAPMALTAQMRISDSHLRPGGTVSGPTMFTLADVAMYLAVLSMIGPKALAVTTNCAIDFMRKPLPNHDLRAEARILKLGRSLAVGDVLIFSDGDPVAPTARASLTYSLPIS